MRYPRKINYVDAVRYTGENWLEIREFVGFKPLGDVIPTHKFGPIQVRTPNGSVDAHPGDWICRDAAGNYYPCADDVFRATYYVEEEKKMTIDMECCKDCPECVVLFDKEGVHGHVPDRNSGTCQSCDRYKEMRQ